MADSGLLRDGLRRRVEPVAQQEARQALALLAQLPGTEDALWKTLELSYFARHDAQDLAWHARALWRHVDSLEPVVRARPSPVGEGLQVLRYRVGAEYQPHYDYFDPRHASSKAILERGGQRVATLVMYLNTPARGGATVFPDIKLDVMAQKGNAVFFSYDRPDPATLTLHGGAPVLEGEKWVATKWLRQGEFV